MQQINNSITKKQAGITEYLNKEKVKNQIINVVQTQIKINDKTFDEQ